MTDKQGGFIPGLDLNERFFHEVVSPILQAALPGLSYSAALIGPGSDALGFDSARSTDHDWGPRLQLFLADRDQALIAEIDDLLRRQLPRRFLGHSTHFGAADEGGVRLPDDSPVSRIDHRIEITTIGTWFTRILGIDPRVDLNEAGWLMIPQQALLSLTAGRVFHDGLGDLEEIRQRLHWYPHDVWLYLLGSQWQRIAQQEPFVGRSGEAGDDLGSRLIVATLVRDLMLLGFLMERRYAPYSKWFGSAFAQLRCAPEITPLLTGALVANTWEEREGHLVSASEIMARRHNELAITPPLDTSPRQFHNRPFRVIGADRFVTAIGESIKSPELRAIIDHAGWIGGIDQISDSVDLKTRAELSARFKRTYEFEGESARS